MSAATLFLSSRRGAIAVEFAPDADALAAGTPLATLTLSYAPAAGGDTVRQVLSPALGGLDEFSAGIRASDAGARKLAALVNMGRVLRESLDQWENGETDGPIESMHALEAHLRAVADQIGDASLAREADLAAALRGNMAELAEARAQVTPE